jgi:hypothetical protein
VSLINDALRKARQAAADHEEQRERSLPRRAYPQRSRRHGVSMVAVALVAVAAGIGGAAIVWWTMSRPEPVPATTVAAAPETARTDPTVSDAASTAATQPVAPGAAATAPTETPTSVVRDVGPSGAAAQPAQSAADARAAVEDGPIDTAAAPEDTKPTPAVSQPKRGPAGERVYVLDADLGKVSLSLGYIVFRPVRPFAEINGVEVYEGSEVEGFTVEKIEADKVTLRDADGPLVLRVP